MALVLKDRVRQTTTSTGASTITLSGSVAGYQSFSVIGTGNTTYYTIAGTSDWEVGIGTWTSPDQLSRDTILASTNGGAAVNFGAGTKDVFVTYPAEKSVNLDANNVANTPKGLQIENASAIPMHIGFDNSGNYDSVVVGGYSLIGTTAGAGNFALGAYILNNPAFSGTQNVCIGGYNMEPATTASQNVFIGNAAGDSMTTGNGNVGIGQNTLTVTQGGSNNVAIGNNALYSNDASDNVAIGNSSLYSNITGIGNTAIGANALFGNFTGSGNFALGFNAMNFGQYGSNNFAIGANAAALVGYVTADANNFAFGNSALNFAGGIDPASNNIAIGNNAMAYAGSNGGTVSSNVAIGNFALSGAGVSSPNALSNTIAIGYNSGASIDGGTNNVIIGGYTGATAPISITGSNYVILSSGSGTVRQTFNGSGALSFNAGTSYGTAGQLLQSNGSGAAPSWGRTITSGTAAPSGGSDGDIYLQYV